MTKEMTDKIQERKKTLEAEFATLAEERTKLIEQGKTMQTRLNAIGARQTQLQGAFDELSKLEAPELGKEAKIVSVSTEKPKTEKK